MNTSSHKSQTRSSFPLRLLVATFTVAIAAGFAQTASAAPGAGPYGQGGGPGHGMMAGGGMGGMQGMHGMQGMAEGRHIERMLDLVNASPEQRAQIKAIAEAARADMKAQFEAGRSLHQQSQALFAQPNIDAAAIETLRQQMLAHHDQVSKRMTQALVDASKLLTPEQRKLMADRMAQRRGMMERHRAERATL